MAPARALPKGRSRSRFVSLSTVCCTAGLAAAVILIVLEISLRRSGDSADSVSNSSLRTDRVKLYGYKVVREYPHDGKAFTQGLLFHGNDTLYESTGLYGMSTVREVHLQTGKVRKLHHMERTEFGEGLTLWANRLLQVAWRTNKGYMYDRETLQPLGTFEHPMQDGWGLTHDGRHIIGSDGTSILYFLHPESLAEVRRFRVEDNGREVKYLNELEYVQGEIWANVWQTECIARISPKDGKVVGWIILEGLRSTLLAKGYKYLDVLNGIAWDSKGDRLFVTGKTWPRLYEIVLEPMAEPIPDQESIHATCIL